MAICPLTRREYPGVYRCAQYLDRSTCGACPAYGWRARLIIMGRWLVRLSLPILMAGALLSPQPAAAAHNESHSCALLEALIREGKAGGYYWLAGTRLTWSDYQTFAVFISGVCQTAYDITGRSYQSRVNYVAKDAANHGAVRVGVSKALTYFRTGGAAAGAGSAVGKLARGLAGAETALPVIVTQYTYCQLYPYDAACHVTVRQ